MKFMLSLIAFIAIAASAALPASATSRWIHNRTAHCVWFTIDTSGAILHYKNEAAAFIAPGQTQHFNVPGNPYLKVRAEPRQTKDCKSNKIADLDITEVGVFSNPGPSETTLRGGEGNPFRLAWGP